MKMYSKSHVIAERVLTCAQINCPKKAVYESVESTKYFSWIPSWNRRSFDKFFLSVDSQIGCKKKKMA